MKRIALFLTLAFFSQLFAAGGVVEPEEKGLPKGAKMVEFGMRSLDLASGTIKKFIWTTDFVGNKEAKEPKKLLILSFYANWCAPCIAEMPFLQQMHEKYSDKGLQVISVNFRNNGEDFEKTLKESINIIKDKKVTYPVLFDRLTSRNQLIYMGNKAILPTLVVIDSEGTIVEKYQGEETKNFKKIEEVINTLIKGGKL